MPLKNLTAESADKLFGPKKKGDNTSPADKLLLQDSIVSAILAKVAAVYGVRVRDIYARDRHACVAEARQVAMTLLVNRGGTYAGIGKALACPQGRARDHGTVLHARRKIAQLIETDKRTALKWSLLKHLGDPDIPIEPKRHYKVFLNTYVDVLAEGDITRDEVERRATVKLFEGRAVPKMVHYTTEKL